MDIANTNTVVSINELAKSIHKVLNIISDPINDGTSLDYVPINAIPSIDKAARVLGYSPKIDLQAGLKRMIDWYQSVHRNKLES